MFKRWVTVAMNKVRHREGREIERESEREKMHALWPYLEMPCAHFKYYATCKWEKMLDS